MSVTSAAASTSTATAAVAKSSAAIGEQKQRRVTRPGPALHAHSVETKRLAAAILEVLAGVRTPTDAANTLEISLSRYYLLEQRALAGLLAACEPRTKGPGRSVERELAQLQRELAASRRDCVRQSRRAGIAARGAARRGTAGAAAGETGGEERRQENAPPPADRAGLARGASDRRQLIWDKPARRSTTTAAS